MIAVLAVSQKGPKTERRYRCRISFQPSRPQSRHRSRPSITSFHALAIRPGPNPFCPVATVFRTLSATLWTILIASRYRESSPKKLDSLNTLAEKKQNAGANVLSCLSFKCWRRKASLSTNFRDHPSN